MRSMQLEMFKDSQPNSLDDLPDLLTVMQMGDVLQISRPTAYKLIHAKGFPVLWVGNKARIPKDQLSIWIRNSTTSLR